MMTLELEDIKATIENLTEAELVEMIGIADRILNRKTRERLGFVGPAMRREMDAFTS